MKTLILTGLLMVAASASFADQCQVGTGNDTDASVQQPTTVVDSKEVDSKNLYSAPKPAEQQIPAGARDTNT